MYFFVMTISGMWDGKRSCAATVSGTIEKGNKTEKDLYNDIYRRAMRKLSLESSGISSDYFVVDVYRLKPNK